jgi:hypothetical protein
MAVMQYLNTEKNVKHLLKELYVEGLPVFQPTFRLQSSWLPSHQNVFHHLISYLIAPHSSVSFTHSFTFDSLVMVRCVEGLPIPPPQDISPEEGTCNVCWMLENLQHSKQCISERQSHPLHIENVWEQGAEENIGHKGEEVMVREKIYIIRSFTICTFH